MIASHFFGRKKTKKLIVFIHVPKTAGTSVNTALRNAGLAGQDHIEHWLQNPSHAEEMIPALDWVSGHIPLPAMRAFLANVTDRELRFFAIVRSPHSQVASHYNWLIEIFHRGSGFYNGHPENIKEISARVRTADNSNPSAIIAQLSMAPGLFLNQQSGVILGDRAVPKTEVSLLEKLYPYEMVTTDAKIEQLIQKMTGTSTVISPYDNKSKYHFDPSVFQTEEMTKFLDEFNAADEFLFDTVKRQTL